MHRIFGRLVIFLSHYITLIPLLNSILNFIMECEIMHRNVRILSRAIQCMAKFGDEVYLKATEGNVLLETINVNKSVMAKFNFSKSFFKNLKLSNLQKDNQYYTSCQLSTKALMLIFKPPIIDKSVEKCLIEFDEQNDKFTIIMHCRYSVVKRYNIPLLSASPIDNSPDVEDLTSTIYSQSRILSNTLSTFNKSVDEITMIAKSDKLTFHNFSEGMLDCSNCMLTEIETGSREFGRYSINHYDPLTFTLKELKSILAFSDSTSQEIEIFFAAQGKPILFALSSDSTYKVHCFLATLAFSSILPLTTDTPSLSQPVTIPQHDLSDIDEQIDHHFYQNKNNDNHHLSSPLLNEDITVYNGSHQANSNLRNIINDATETSPPSDQIANVKEFGFTEDNNVLIASNRSPPAKKFRFEVFRDVFMTSIDIPFDPNTTSRVLAPDSDEEY